MNPAPDELPVPGDISPPRRPSALKRYLQFMLSVGAARGGGILLAAATLPFLVRKLGVEMFGVWSYVGAIVPFVGVVANPGITSYAQQQVSARRGEALHSLSDALGLRCLTGLAAALLLSAIALLAEPNPLIRSLLLWFGIGQVLLNIFSNDYLLNAMERFHEASLQLVLTQGLYALVVFTMVRSPQDIGWVVAATLLSTLAANLYGWRMLGRLGLRFRPTFRLERWRLILRPSADYTLASLMSMVYSRIYAILIRWTLGEYALGLFAAATRFVEVVFGFINILHGLIQPRLSLRAAQGAPLGRIYRLGAASLALSAVPFVVGGILTAPALVPWALGLKYLDSVPLFQWALPYLLAASASTFFTGTVLYGLGRHRRYLISTACGALAAACSCAALIPLMGLKGACIAYTLGQSGVAVSGYLLCPAGISESLRSPLLPLSLLASVPMSAVLLLIPAGVLHPLGAVALGGAAYLACVWLFGASMLRKELDGLA